MWRISTETLIYDMEFLKSDAEIDGEVSMDSEVFTMEWEGFIGRAKNNLNHDFSEGLELLNEAYGYFNNRKFLCMSEEQRRNIAGIAIGEERRARWDWFGRMSGNGFFANRVINNNHYISKALDNIPLDGCICKKDYELFVKYYRKAFAKAKNHRAAVTRLLAIKRPDYFLCLTSTNADRFCKDFGITESSLTVDNYWDEVVERIQECVWWREDPSQSMIETEKDAWRFRAALLDTIYYDKSI